MKVQHCDREQEVLEAVRQGTWANPLNDSLRRHVAECAVCAEVMQVTHFLTAECTRADAALPDAGLVWWKAQIRARREAAERAAQPIAIAEKVACVWAVLATAGIIIWQWPRLAGWASQAIGVESINAFIAPFSRVHPGSFWNACLALWGQHPETLLVAALGIGLLLVASVLGIAWGEQ